MYVWKNFLVHVFSNLNIGEKNLQLRQMFKIKIVILVPKADIILGKAKVLYLWKKMSYKRSRMSNRGEKTDLY